MILEFYKNNWYGQFNGEDKELLKLLSFATDIVDNAIFLSGYTVKTVPETLKKNVYKAVCAHTDYISMNGGIESLSEVVYNSVSLGKFSYSSDTSGSTDNGVKKLCPLALGYLTTTGLLYKGVNVY